MPEVTGSPKLCDVDAEKLSHVPWESSTHNH